VLGAPFDTATTYRPGLHTHHLVILHFNGSLLNHPGTRFGPSGIRDGSALIGGHNRIQNIDPWKELHMVDCGDAPLTFFDNMLALNTLEKVYKSIIERPTKKTDWKGVSVARDRKHHPRVMTLGGDHTIVLPILRALEPVYGKVTVIHFDSHLDT
jgi:agmatinase